VRVLVVGGGSEEILLAIAETGANL
jgi:hypothetical protein